MEIEVIKCNHRTITKTCLVDNDSNIYYGKVGKSMDIKKMRFYKSRFDPNGCFKKEEAITKKDFKEKEKTLRKVDIKEYKEERLSSQSNWRGFND